MLAKVLSKDLLICMLGVVKECPKVSRKATCKIKKETDLGGSCNAVNLKKYVGVLRSARGKFVFLA